MNERYRPAARPPVFSPAALLVILLALPLAGCVMSREISNTRRDIERAYPGLELDRQVVLNLGPVSLRMLGWMAGLTSDPDAEMASRYLRDVRRVKVGVFRAGQNDAWAEFGTRGFGFEKGWEVAVRSKQGDERVWVLYRDDEHTVRDLYFVVLSDEELVVARVSGKLDRLLARVMEDHVELGDWVGANL